MHSTQNPADKVCILLGAAALVAAALLAGSYLLEQRKAGQDAALLLTRIEQWEAQPQEEVDGAVVVEAPEGEVSVWDNYDVDGVLSIPDLGLELPILSQYSEELLAVSPCIYQGGDGSSSQRLVIAGHNYRAHFGFLDQLSPGDKVTYQSLDHTETQFQVTKLEEIGEEDAGLLEEGEWDLTLLTCNWDMSKRLLVRCDKISQSS